MQVGVEAMHGVSLFSLYEPDRQPLLPNHGARSLVVGLEFAVRRFQVHLLQRQASRFHLSSFRFMLFTRSS